ncbi:tetraspanin Tsp2 family [Mycena floridula]|nr:tetraspanin Tsp2 family [Mycena floridula]
MQYRAPSLASGSAHANSIRRRSGGSPLSRRHISAEIQPSRSFSPQFADSPSFDIGHSFVGDEAITSFTSVPLTPRPERNHSFQSTQTRASRITRLPTPDYTAEPRARSQGNRSRLEGARSALSRGLSFISFRAVPASLGFLPYQQRPTSIRSESGETLYTVKTSGSNASSRTAVSAHSIPDKFTHKWPRLRSSLRRLDQVGSSRKASARLAASEDGRGLGIDKVEKWTSFKWCLVISVALVFIYGLIALIWAIATWFGAWDHADVMYVADYDILILITLAGSILVFTALVGMTGTVLDSRPILATYALLLWPALLSMLAVGYSSYRRSTFSLDHKLNFSWSKYYTDFGRLLIQNSLRCCGYYSPLHSATFSNRCYPRTPLPGCKGVLYRFEQANLGVIWSATFSVVPLHFINIAVSLLCSNHVTKTFGKGLTPKQYRLSGADVKADAEKISMGMGMGGVTRPEISRANSSGLFREDRQVYFR